MNTKKLTKKQEESHNKKLKWLKVYKILKNIGKTCKYTNISRQLYYFWTKNDSEFVQVKKLIDEELTKELDNFTN